MAHVCTVGDVGLVDGGCGWMGDAGSRPATLGALGHGTLSFLQYLAGAGERSALWLCCSVMRW